MKIGFFDSGLGGLTILKSVAKSLPDYDYVFYGDTAHLPLGDKTEAEIFEYTKAGVEELFLNDCILVIIACNTASAETLRLLQDTYLTENYPDRRILGVIIPTVETLINSGSRNALLIATRRTVESHKYEIELNHRSPHKINLLAVATPTLVPLIERGESGEAMQEAIKVIDQVQSKNACDTVVLGCTHYTKLKDGLRAHYGGGSFASAAVEPRRQETTDLHILSQDEIIPEKLAYYLERHPEIKSRLSQTSSRSIKLSLYRPDYDLIVQELLGGVML